MISSDLIGQAFILLLLLLLLYCCVVVVGTNGSGLRYGRPRLAVSNHVPRSGEEAQRMNSYPLRSRSFVRGLDFTSRVTCQLVSGSFCITL
jgi:hypothetical protein